MSIKIPYIRKEKLTLFSSSAIAMLLLAASPLLLLSNPLLVQPVQATNLPSSIQLRNPVALGDNCNVANTQITFDAQGNRQTMTSGTFQITNISTGQTLWSGDISSSESGSGGNGDIWLVYNVNNNGYGDTGVCSTGGTELWVDVYCGDGSPDNPNISLETNLEAMGAVSGVVDCDSGGDTTAAQPSSSMTGTTTPTQDSDGDGIPDSSDRCTHNSNHRCFKEDTATHQEQQPSSSSSRTGNQTG